MARGVERSPEEKAAAMAALLAGQSIDQVAAKYKLPEGTVKSWRREMAGMVTTPTPAAQAQRERVGDLVISNLEAMLTAVREIVTRVSQDPQWIREQGASELGVFLGILSDKAFRILEALPEPEDDESAGILAGGAGETEAAVG